VPHEWIDASKQVAGRDAVLKMEEIKELVLIPVLPTHHDQASAAANRQQTESLVAKNHEGFFNIIDPVRTLAIDRAPDFRMFSTTQSAFL